MSEERPSVADGDLAQGTAMKLPTEDKKRDVVAGS